MQGVDRNAGDAPSGVSPQPALPEEIRAELARVVASPEFSVTERGRAFLRYVVGETLAGRAERIKAYSIAIEVFERDEGFTQDDPVVRIEAGRLRRALERYYLVAGQADQIQIDIPKGGYVPVFTRRAKTPIESTPDEHPNQPEPSRAASHRWWRARWVIPAALVGLAGLSSLGTWIISQQKAVGVTQVRIPEGPTLVIAPFVNLGEGPDAKLYALGLTEELLTDLPRFKEIRVFGRETSEALSSQADASHIHRELGAQYLLAGGVRLSAGRVRVTARLVETATGEILWSQTYDDDLRSRDLFAIQSDVAGKVASAVAQPYGIMSLADTARRQQLPPDDLNAYLCTLRFYTYRAELSAEEHGAVRECLERAVARFPTYATALAMLSIVYLDEDRFAFNPRGGSPTPLERALDAARQAVQLDPGNTRALQALMTALFFNQQLVESLRIGERALALNPNDTELMGEFGSRLALGGQWQRGAKLLEETLARNPGGSGYYRGVLGLAAYMQQDFEKAAVEIRQANLQKFPLFHVVAAIIYAERGMTGEAKREGDIFVKMSPKFLANIEAELEKRNFQPEDRTRLIAGLRKAGLLVPANAPAAPLPATTVSDELPRQ